MSNTYVDEMAISKSDRTFPEIEKNSKNMAVTISMPFAEVKHLLEGYPAPKRPSRVRPIHHEEPALQGELDAWEAASDEALESSESDLLDKER